MRAITWHGINDIRTDTVPEPQILHMESPSMVSPLGAKGIGEGNCMSTPACIANAVADALEAVIGAVASMTYSS